MAPKAEEHLKLPINVVSRTDVGRLVREVSELDEFLKQSKIREPGTQPKLPKTSRMLDEFLSLNQLNALHEDDRHRLYMFLQTIKERAPVLHMSFAADPSPRFQQRLMTWLRINVDSMVLVQFGLQPNIGAGLVMRTTNKYFDLSLREFFKSKRNLLVEKIHGTDDEITREEEKLKQEEIIREQATLDKPENGQQPAAPASSDITAAAAEPEKHEVSAAENHPQPSPAVPRPATAPEAPAAAPATATAPAPAAALSPAPATSTPVAPAPAPNPLVSAPPAPPPVPQATAPALPEPAATVPAAAPVAPPANYQPPKPLVGDHSGSPKP
jgi:hypothetical protein